jgi:hypothetical protein
MNTSRPQTPPAGPPANWLDIVRAHMNSLQFGTVEIVVHDARVVQIEKTERVRLGAGETNRTGRLTGPGTNATQVSPASEVSGERSPL